MLSGPALDQHLGGSEAQDPRAATDRQTARSKQLPSPLGRGQQRGQGGDIAELNSARYTLTRNTTCLSPFLLMGSQPPLVYLSLSASAAYLGVPAVCF